MQAVIPAAIPLVIVTLAMEWLVRGVGAEGISCAATQRHIPDHDPRLARSSSARWARPRSAL